VGVGIKKGELVGERVGGEGKGYFLELE